MFLHGLNIHINCGVYMGGLPFYRRGLHCWNTISDGINILPINKTEFNTNIKLIFRFRSKVAKLKNISTSMLISRVDILSKLKIVRSNRIY